MLFYFGLIGINLLGFIICFFDKKKAIKKQYRISEKILLLISLMGGAFGFTLGMTLFHHKTKKFKFIFLETLFIIFWIFIIFKDLLN